MGTGGFDSPNDKTEGGEVGVKRGKGRARYQRWYNHRAAPEQADAHAARCGCRMTGACVYIGPGHRAMGGLELRSECLALGVGALGAGRGESGIGTSINVPHRGCPRRHLGRYVRKMRARRFQFELGLNSTLRV